MTKTPYASTATPLGSILSSSARRLRCCGWEVYTTPCCETATRYRPLEILLAVAYPPHTKHTMSSTVNETKDKTTNERKTEAGTAPSQDNQQPAFGILPHPAVSTTYLNTYVSRKMVV